MNIISNLKTITIAEMARLKEVIERPSAPALVITIENARRDWKQALMELDHIDNDLAEYVIFKINSAERRYMALLEQAKKEGVTAWPDSATFINRIVSGGNSGEVSDAPMYTG